MSDLSIVQEFLDIPRIGAKIGGPISVDDLILAARALRDIGPNPNTTDREIISCLNRLLLAIGPDNVMALVDHPVKCDDAWAEWCPSPKGIALHAADCPAGTTPLWSNGSVTVFCRVTPDAHGNRELDFGSVTAN